MKISRFTQGHYIFSGLLHGEFVQYSIMRFDHGWRVTRTYGNGPMFYGAYPTKRAAVDALTSCNPDTVRSYAC